MKKIILIILLICWMITIFMFSSQQSEKSSKTSKSTIEFVLDKLSITDNMSISQKEQAVENLQTPIRKLAHFSIYAVGGIVSFALANQFNIKIKKKIIIALVICVIYAITDELHQYFVPGRSSEIRDVLIDSTGAMLGIFICNIKNIVNAYRKRANHC